MKGQRVLVAGMGSELGSLVAARLNAGANGLAIETSAEDWLAGAG